MKELMIQQDEQGWDFTEGWVCEECVSDHSLKKAIGKDVVNDEHCDFCKSSPAAPLDSLLAAFVSGLKTEHGDADGSRPRRRPWPNAPERVPISAMAGSAATVWVAPTLQKAVDLGPEAPLGDRRTRARTILVEMEPTVEERLARIREVAHRSLRYYATAYLKTDVAEEHVIAERDLLMAYMTDLANVMALLDGNELDDRAMLAARHEVLSRYVEAVGEDPWVPPTTPGGS